VATARLPAYVNPRPLAGGRTGYFWIRPDWANPARGEKAMRHGKPCPIESTPLGTDLAEAIVKATAINAAFKEWREGKTGELVPGTVRWLFHWYRQQDRFTKNRHKTREGYTTAMNMVEEVEMQIGKFGQRKAGVVDGPAADALYAKAREKHGERQGSYMMQVCRLVWNHASRPGYTKTTGVKDSPFSRMGITASSGAGKGNLAATRAEYDIYRETARAMGKQSMATAAALCFECCQRVTDAFGFEDPDGLITRGFYWDDYVPGVRISVVQSKTGKLITLPLVDGEGEDAVQLYPELEAELARTPRTDGAVREMIAPASRTPRTICSPCTSGSARRRNCHATCASPASGTAASPRSATAGRTIRAQCPVTRRSRRRQSTTRRTSRRRGGSPWFGARTSR
jgi:hypothetical protein